MKKDSENNMENSTGSTTRTEKEGVNDMENSTGSTTRTEKEGVKQQGEVPQKEIRKTTRKTTYFALRELRTCIRTGIRISAIIFHSK